MKRNAGDICDTCKIRKIRIKGRNKKGELSYGKECFICNCIRYNVRTPYYHLYTTHKKKICEECGFIAKNPCQLDIHHIDNNHLNDDINNLQTLCANCHRLKHFLARKQKNKEIT